MGSGPSHHITRMRSMFHSVSETYSYCYVDSGVDTMHAMKEVGCVSFLLESQGSLEMVEVLFVLESKVSSL